MGSVYWVNGKSMDWTSLIRLADDKGCKWADGMLRPTPEAADYLRSLGYKVLDKPPKAEV